jgi:NADH-quinone oxidoreductase subunit A
MSEYLWVALFLAVGVIFCIGGFVTSWLLRTDSPNPKKLSSYECGEVPFGSAQIQYDAKYYLYALLFVIFDVEIVFILPWATLLKGSFITPLFLFVEMAIFIAILVCGLIYAGKKGALRWS